MPEENVKTYTFEEIAEHDTEESTWIVIQDEVYDVTKFLEEHPGGAEVILDWAGREDATDAFEGAGHSNDARQQMKAFKIGEISEKDKIERENYYRTLDLRNCFRKALIYTGVVVAGILVYKLIQMRK